MALDAIWQKFAMLCYQLWSWLYYQTNAHPFLALGVLAVIILAWGLNKIEVRAK
ncbi:MAG: hypothetical protein WBV23_11650 [Desulfobaccales bacterium]